MTFASIQGKGETGASIQDGVETGEIAKSRLDASLAGFRDWLQDNLGFSHLPSWAESLGILFVAIVLAKVVDLILTRVLLRLAARTPLKIDDAIIEMLHRPLMGSIVVLGMSLATQPFELEALWLGRTLHTIALMLWVPFAFQSTTLLLRAASDDDKLFRAIEPRTYPLFDNLGKVLLFTAFTYIVFSKMWGVDPGGFLVSAGVVGIALGFAAQDTLSNLFAGVFIIADSPYGVGDFIRLDSGERGRVQHIGLRSTRILTRDDIEITIPNSVMGQAKITNEAGGPSPKHRIRIPISCAYGTDVDLVKRVLMEVGVEEESVCNSPEPRARFRNFGDSGLNFELQCWIDEPARRGKTVDALNTQIYKGFQAAGIEIPYPKQDLFLHRVDPVTEDDGAHEPTATGTDD